MLTLWLGGSFSELISTTLRVCRENKILKHCNVFNLFIFNKSKLTIMKTITISLIYFIENNYLYFKMSLMVIHLIINYR